MITPELLAALEPLLDRALELPAEERVRLVAEVQRDTPELARELEALLAVERDLDDHGFLTGRSPLVPAIGSSPTRRRSPAAPSAPTRSSGHSARAEWAPCGWRVAAMADSRAASP